MTPGQDSRSARVGHGSRWRAARALAWLALGSLCAEHAGAETARRVRLCDEILVTLSGDEVVQSTATVSPEGLVEIDGIGSIAAAGQSPEGLARSIEIVSRERARTLVASVSIVRSNSPGCSVVTLPPQPRPEREPIPDPELEIETAPQLEPAAWPPDAAASRTSDATSEQP